MYELKKTLGKQIEKQVAKNFSEQTKFLSELVRTKSVNPGEKVSRKTNVETDASKLIRKQLLDMGLRPRYLRARAGRPNLSVTWGPTRARKSVLLVGNMDTSAPTSEDLSSPFSGTVRDGRLFGTGAFDMKGSLSAYIYAFKALSDLGLKLDGKLKMAFTADGKADVPSRVGLSFMLNKGLRAKAAIMSKPGTDKIAIGHRGGYRFKITTHGQSVNTGVKAWERGKKGKNAILQMWRVIKALSSFDLPYKPARAFPGRLPVFTFPTKVVGGTAIDMVPNRCEAWGDVRLLPGNTDVQVKHWIEDRLEGLEGLDWEIEDVLFVPSMEIEKSDHWVQSIYTQSQEVLEKAPKLEGCGPWNDSWMLTQKDVPCIAGFGPDGGEDEEEGEWVDLSSLEKVTAIYARSIVDYLGEKKGQ